MSTTRRHFLKAMGAGGAALAGAPFFGRSGARAQAGPTDPKFLIVLGASGGASIIDGMLAIKASECATPDVINTFPDEMVTEFDGSPFRAVDQAGTDLGPIPAAWSARHADFVGKHRDHTMVATWTRTSVNHAIGQRRAITGNEAWLGRTMQEIVAMQYGADYPIPNVQLATGTAYIEAGSDPSMPPWARGELVANPALWPLALDGVRGINGPDRALVDKARALRNDTLDPESRFVRVFQNSARLQEWVRQRGLPQKSIEQQDLITKLMLFPDSPVTPLIESGLSPSPAGERVREVFPNYAIDPFEAQAALAFLLLKYRVAVTVTLSPSFNVVLDGGLGQGGLPEGVLKNPPIAFDFSHQAHRAVQSFMWERIYRVADGLITLLQEEEYQGGQSLWDRSLIYVATDFGRQKTRPAGAAEFGSAHNLNNGVAIFSPLVPGNTVRGGVDPNTGLTYGFDPLTGAPEPGRQMEEAEIFAGILGALDIDTTGSGLPAVPAMRV